VDPYIHFPIRLHGIVLSQLSTGATSPYQARAVLSKIKGRGQAKVTEGGAISPLLQPSSLQGAQLITHKAKTSFYS
jgi:hypothetical protein